MVSMVAINNMIKDIETFKAAPLDPKDVFYFTTMNIMASFLIGKTYERGSDYHNAFLELEDALQA